jgi:hypothetical protein
MRWCGILCLVFIFLSCVGTVGYTQLDSAHDMQFYVNRMVALRGRISDTPWQHLMGNPPGLDRTYYFDVDDFQIVIYAGEPIACDGPLTVRGLVMKIQGPPKRVGAKVDETYVEYHLAVDGWECGE